MLRAIADEAITMRQKREKGEGDTGSASDL